MLRRVTSKADSPGSHAYELLPVPAHCARLQLREVQRRWAMFGLKGNLEITVNEGDFRVHPTVAKRLREADVVVGPVSSSPPLATSSPPQPGPELTSFSW